MPCQFLVDGSYCKGFLGGCKVPNENELKAYCKRDFKSCPTYQKKAEYDSRSIKKEGDMAENEIFRVLYLDDQDKTWKIKGCPDKRAAEQWMIDYPGARLVSFAAVPAGGTKIFFETKEAANAFAAKNGNCPVQPVYPGDDVPQQALDLVYKL